MLLKHWHIFRKLCTLDIKATCNDIQESSFIENLPNNLPELVEPYNNSIQDISDKHTPVHNHTITIHPQAPCYNESIHNEKQLRRKLEISWRKTKLEVANQNHLDQCATVNIMFLKAKRDNYSTRIANMAGNQRVLFKETAKLHNHNTLQN